MLFLVSVSYKTSRTISAIAQGRTSASFSEFATQKRMLVKYTQGLRLRATKLRGRKYISFLKAQNSCNLTLNKMVRGRTNKVLILILSRIMT